MNNFFRKGSEVPDRTQSSAQNSWLQRGKSYMGAAQETLLETLWPTRCALCDAPGSLLCAECKLTLPYIDYWRRCKRCGAAFGAIQCCECNPVMLAGLGLKSSSFADCVSVLHFEEGAARLITTYKDKNEQGLAPHLASMMRDAIPPSWLGGMPMPRISFIPSSLQAYRRRGFDHAEMLARELSAQTGLSLAFLFERPRSKDQRVLSRHERIFNMEQRFKLSRAWVPPSILLIDDVYTTGATLNFASKKLIEAGAEQVRCISIARAW